VIEPFEQICTLRRPLPDTWANHAVCDVRRNLDSSGRYTMPTADRAAHQPVISTASAMAAATVRQYARLLPETPARLATLLGMSASCSD